jgi:hypothetical protein
MDSFVAELQRCGIKKNLSGKRVTAPETSQILQMFNSGLKTLGSLKRRYVTAVPWMLFPRIITALFFPF